MAKPYVRFKASHLNSVNAPVETDSVCWICGSPATSGEHIIKRSDITKVRGAISQQNPVLLTRDYKRYKIGSARNPRTKYADMLCETCNTTTTQPFDRAWDAFVDRVRPIADHGAMRRISTHDIFGEDRQSDVDVQLYLAKVLGCAMKENGLDTQVLSAALLGRTAPPTMRVLFRSLPTNKDLFLSSIFAVVKAGKVFSAQACSDTGTLRCVIVLGKFPDSRPWPPSAWRPTARPTEIVVWPERRDRINAQNQPAYRWPMMRG